MREDTRTTVSFHVPAQKTFCQQSYMLCVRVAFSLLLSEFDSIPTMTVNFIAVADKQVRFSSSENDAVSPREIPKSVSGLVTESI
jgi:hypothetical protein